MGFDNVIKTKMPLLVMSGVGVSLSTTVSILTIACMALLRWLDTLNAVYIFHGLFRADGPSLVQEMI